MTPTIRKTFGSNGFGVSAHSLGKPAALYPGAVAGDAQLKIAVDRLQTTLATSLNDVALTMTVTSAGGIVANTLLSIDDEIVSVTGPPTGNVVPIARGFDGTTPAIHLSGATVAGLVDAWHHNALVSEIEAIENALGPNLSHVPASAFTVSSAFIFPPQQPNVPLTVGTNVITLAPVPAGINGTDLFHSLWISGGTGAPEAVQITGGNAVAGSASGTLFFNCVNAHTGAWTIQTATSGIQEAIQSLDTAGTGGTVWIPPGHWTLHAGIVISTNSTNLNGAGRSATILTADLNVCPAITVGESSRSAISSVTISNFLLTRAAGTIPANCVGVQWQSVSYGSAISVEYSRHYIAEKLTLVGGSAGNTGIGFNSLYCWMYGNVYAHIYVEHYAGVKYTCLYMGSPVEVSLNYGAPEFGVVITADANDVKFIHCDWLPTPATNQPNAMQWCVLFTAIPAGQQGIYIFEDCNFENCAQGVVTSDATCLGVRWFEFIGGRVGFAAATLFSNFNAATVVAQFLLTDANISAKIQLTAPTWSRIVGCTISGAMTITGGDILVANNIFTAAPIFTGTFTCLNIGTNTFVFNASAPIRPDLSGAAGYIFFGRQADDAPNNARLPIGAAEGLGIGISGGSLTVSDTFFVCTNNGTVTTIPLPYPTFAGMIYIAITQPVTFATGGNIAVGLSATAGQLVVAGYSKLQGKWFLK